MKTIKKLFFLLILFLLSLSFVACNDNKENGNNVDEQKEVHECKHVCPECGKCMDPECKDAKCAEKCQGHEIETHECKHICPECGKCMDPDCLDPVCNDKCQGHEIETHECKHICPECGKCMDPDCLDPVCNDKCQGHDVEPLPTYTIKFYNGDTLLSEQVLEEGRSPVVPTNLTKEATGRYVYEFAGWDKEIDEAYNNEEYHAVWEAVLGEMKMYTSLEGLKLSILGDSVSTFYSDKAPSDSMRSYYTGDNEFYYPRYCPEVDSVDKTWWGQLINNTNMVLGINNSWSGSTAGGDFKNAGYQDSRVNTLNENGEPDIIIYYLGTNDVVCGLSASSFKQDLVKTLEKINKKNDSQIFLTALSYTNYTGGSYSMDLVSKYNAVIRAVAKTYGYGVIDLDNYLESDSYMFYMYDYLHFNYKGTTLVSKIMEKAIKEFNGITYDKEIEVERKEPLPEGTLGVVTATSNEPFFTEPNFKENVFFYAKDDENLVSPLFSYRIKINFVNDKYYVSDIVTTGNSLDVSDCDYLLAVSDSHNSSKAILADLENVKIGSIVEWDSSNGFPFEVIFSEGDGGYVAPEPVVIEIPSPVNDDGDMFVCKFNQGVWAADVYEDYIIMYDVENLGQDSTYVNYYSIGLSGSCDEGFSVVYLKNYGTATDWSAVSSAGVTHFILIYNSLNLAIGFAQDAQIGDEVTVVSGKVDDKNLVLHFASGGGVIPTPPEALGENEIAIDSINTGVWSLYTTSIFMYDKNSMDLGSLYSGFNSICFKLVEGNQYEVCHIYGAGTAINWTEATDCEYFLLISSEYNNSQANANTLANNLKVGDKVTFIYKDNALSKISID